MRDQPRSEELIIEVSDAGPATRAPVAGNGIRGMVERARAVGGARIGSGSRAVCGCALLPPVGEDRSMTISVAVVDDQALVRMGLRVLIESEDDLELAGEAENGRAAVELVRRPDPT